MTKLKVAERAELEGLEGDRSVSKEGIMPWRNVADARVKKEGGKRGAPWRMEKTEGGTARGAAGGTGKGKGAVGSKAKAEKTSTVRRKAGMMSTFFGSPAQKAARGGVSAVASTADAGYESLDDDPTPSMEDEDGGGSIGHSGSGGSGVDDQFAKLSFKEMIEIEDLALRNRSVCTSASTALDESVATSARRSRTAGFFRD